MVKLQLVVEKSGQELWGRVIYNENIISEVAGSVGELEDSLKKLLVEFEDLSDVEFDIAYDVYALFERFDMIKISKFANYAGINPGLLRQYASGVKYPRKEQALKIEAALHKYANELRKASVYAE